MICWIVSDIYPAWQINILFKFYLFFKTYFHFFLDFNEKKNYTILRKWDDNIHLFGYNILFLFEIGVINAIEINAFSGKIVCDAL